MRSLLGEAGSEGLRSKISWSLSPASDKAEKERDPGRFPVAFAGPRGGVLMSVIHCALWRNEGGKKRRSISCCAGKNLDPQNQHETEANGTAEHDGREASGRGHCVAQTWLAETLGGLFLQNRSRLFMRRSSTAESKMRPSGGLYQIPRTASLCFLRYCGWGRGAQRLTPGNVPTRAPTAREGR